MNLHICAVHLAAGVTRALALAMVLAGIGDASASSGEQDPAPARISPWPCRLIVDGTLLGVVRDSWERSATLRHQCRELAEARAVVVLEWRKSPDSQSRAITRMGTDSSGVVVATVSVPPVSDVIELVAHELEHVLERVGGLDLAAQSRRRGSRIWKAFGGFESQRAIDTGRQVAREVEASRRTR